MTVHELHEQLLVHVRNARAEAELDWNDGPKDLRRLRQIQAVERTLLDWWNAWDETAGR